MLLAVRSASAVPTNGATLRAGGVRGALALGGLHGARGKIVRNLDIWQPGEEFGERRLRLPVRLTFRIIASQRARFGCLLASPTAPLLLPKLL